VAEFAPITSTGNTMPVTAGAGDACKVRLAVPRTASVDALVAVTVTVVCAATLLGVDASGRGANRPSGAGASRQVLNGKLLDS
jgi:hypothetical protein